MGSMVTRIRRARMGDHRVTARDDPRAASEDLRCVIAVVGHSDGLPEAIERVRRVLAAGTPRTSSGTSPCWRTCRPNPKRTHPARCT